MSRQPETDDEKLILKVIGPVYKRLKSPNFLSSDTTPIFCANISLNYPIAFLTIKIEDGNLTMILEIDLGRETDGDMVIHHQDKETYEYGLSDPGSLDKIRDKLDELVNTWEYRPKKHTP